MAPREGSAEWREVGSIPAQAAAGRQAPDNELAHPDGTCPYTTCTPTHTHTHIQRPLGTPPRTTGLRAVDVNTLLPATVPSCSGGLEGEQHLHVTNSGVPRAQHRPSTSHRNDGMRAALGRGGQHTGAGGSAHGMAQVQNNVS